MKVERTWDTQLITMVCAIPEIWDTIAEDGITPDEFFIDTEELWLAAYDDEGFVGLFNLHLINSITLQIHPMILPSKRGKAAYEAGAAVLRWVVENTDCLKVIAYIPHCYRNVKLYAMRCGLAEEGNIRSSYLKCGKIHHMWLLGITRDEIEARHYEQGSKNAIRRH